MRHVELRQRARQAQAVVARLQGGERVILPDAGRPIGLTDPLGQQQRDELLKYEAAPHDGLGWPTVSATVSESAFAFWDYPEDAVWDTAEVQSLPQGPRSASVCLGPE